MEQTITVTPMSQRFSLNPGETFEGKITVANPVDATEDYSYSISVAPYSVVGSDYTANLTVSTERTKIADWITIPEPKGSLKPNEVREIPFTITVPENAPAGGQYAAITITSDAPSGSSAGLSVKNIIELTSIIYASVGGETVNDGKILENNVPGFSFSVPVEVSAQISNNSNVHEDAFITLAVKNLLTGEEILPNESETGQYSELIMPESTRYITRNISNLPSLGLLHVVQSIRYNGEVSITEKNLVICPLWFIILVGATLGAIAALIVKRIRRSHFPA